MPGIKRQRTEDESRKSNGAKKIKAAPATKSDKKFAMKAAKFDPTKSKGDGITTAKIEKKSSEQTDSEGLVESDTTEDENGFYGFSANEDEVEADSSAELEESNEEDSSTGGKTVQPKKMAKGDQGKLPKADSTLKGSVDGANATNSRESHIKQKALARERKAAKPNADQIQRAKKIWERLRIKSSVPKEERVRLVAEVFEIVTGQVKDFVFKHDSVRPVQTAIKYGTMEQRRMIAEELKGSYKDLMAGKYSRHLIGKLLENGDEQIAKMIIPEFYGSVRRLINHPDASWMLDDIYRVKATKQQKAVMLREWYGPDFAIFKSMDQDNLSADLSEILAKNPEKRKPVLEYLHGLINQLIQKKLTGFTMLHDAMLQYFLQLEPGSTDFNDCIRLIIGDKKEEEEDLLKNLAFTKSGARLVCLVLAHGGAKDRKLVLKSFKDAVELVARDQWGWQILVTAYDVIDDTRETISRIFSELVSHGKTEEKQALQEEKILGLSSHLYGRIALLYPFVGAAKWLLPKKEQQDFVSEIHKIRTKTSKKSPDIRRQELAVPLSPPCINTIAEHATSLAKDPFGCQFITAILLSTVGDKSAAVKAVADLATGDPSAQDHLAQSANAGRMLKALIAGGHFDPKEKKVVVTAPDLCFAEVLYENIKAHTLDWATGDSSFVVVALLEAEWEAREELRASLKKGKKQLDKAASGSGNAEAEKKRKRKGGDEQKAKGNAGARILLGLLEA